MAAPSHELLPGATASSQPGLVLVVEDGVFITSNGRKETDATFVPHIVEYAQGLDPSRADDPIEFATHQHAVLGQCEQALFFPASIVRSLLKGVKDWDIFRVAITTNGRGVGQACLRHCASRQQLKVWDRLVSAVQLPLFADELAAR